MVADNLHSCPDNPPTQKCFQGLWATKWKGSNEALTCVANQMTHNLRYILTSPVKQHLYPRIEFFKVSQAAQKSAGVLAEEEREKESVLGVYSGHVTTVCTIVSCMTVCHQYVWVYAYTMQEHIRSGGYRVRVFNTNRSLYSCQNYWAILNVEYWSCVCLLTLIKLFISIYGYTACTVCTTAFLVLALDSIWFWILCSYTLLL